MAGLSLPVSLLPAELDPASDPASMRALADRLPQSSLHVIAGAAQVTPFSDAASLGRPILGLG